MNLYAESSAVLAWLFHEKAEPEILAALKRSEGVVSSELTLIECDRAIWRAIALGKTNEAGARDLCAALLKSRLIGKFRASPKMSSRGRASPFPTSPSARWMRSMSHPPFMREPRFRN